MRTQRDVITDVLHRFLEHILVHEAKAKGKIAVQFGLCTLSDAVVFGLRDEPGLGKGISEHILRVAYLFPEELELQWKSFLDLTEVVILAAPAMAQRRS